MTEKRLTRRQRQHAYELLASIYDMSRPDLRAAADEALDGVDPADIWADETGFIRAEDAVLTVLAQEGSEG